MHMTMVLHLGGLTLLEDRGAVHLDDGVLVFVLLVVGHVVK